MRYATRLKIGDVYVYEANQVKDAAHDTFITNVKLKNSTSMSAMTIGATACDGLFFTMHNPYKTSFDGELIEFEIKALGDTSENNLGDIEDSVGNDYTTELLDETNTELPDDDDWEEGDDLGADEAAEADAEEDDLTESQFGFAEGEDDDEYDEDDLDDEEPTWISYGKFYVYAQNTSTKDNVATFECYDGFSLMTDLYTPNVELTGGEADAQADEENEEEKVGAPVQEFFEDFRQQCLDNCGIEVEDYEFSKTENIKIKWDAYCTYRDAIGFFAGIAGGFADIDEDGVLGISLYSMHDRVILKNRVVKFNETSGGEMTLDGIECDNALGMFSSTKLLAGTDASVTFKNPFVTQEILDDIYREYAGVRYSGAELTMIWDSGIQAGEFVRIMTKAEYENYLQLRNALPTVSGEELIDLKEKIANCGTVVLVSNQTISFGGDATTQISSICGTEFSKASRPMSEIEAAFKNLYAETIRAEYIEAEEIVVKALKAGSAEIQDALIQNLEVKTINGNIIKDSTVLAKALSHEAVITRSGMKVYYCTEDLMTNYYNIHLEHKSADDPDETKPSSYFVDVEGHVMKDGDTWYKTVVPAEAQENSTDNRMFEYAKIMSTWKNGQWVVTPLDAELFRAGTITAREISSDYVYAGTLDSTQIMVSDDTLDTVIANISDEAGEAYGLANSLVTKVSITSDGVNIKNASNQTVASYGRSATMGKTGEGHMVADADGVHLKQGTTTLCDFTIVDNSPVIKGTEIELLGSSYAGLADDDGNLISIENGHAFIEAEYVDINGIAGVRSESIYNNTRTYAANLYIGTSPYQICRTTNTSSRRYKHDIKPLTAYDPHKLYDVEVIQFKYNSDHLSADDERFETPIPGVVAEDVDKILPIIVDHNEEGQAESWNRDLTIPLMLQLIQEQHNEIEELKARMEELIND